MNKELKQAFQAHGKHYAKRAVKKLKEQFPTEELISAEMRRRAIDRWSGMSKEERVKATEHLRKKNLSTTLPK